MPNRILKESICLSEKINKLNWIAEVVFYRLIVHCDDYGAFDGRPLVIKNTLFPLKENLTVATVTKAITELATAGLVVPYEVGGKPYLRLPTWTKHQRVRDSRAKYPLFCETGSNDGEGDPKVDDSDKNELKNGENDSLPQVAASCGELPRVAANCRLNPNPNPNPNKCTSTAGARTRTRARTVPVPIPKNAEEVAEYCKANNLDVDAQRFFDTYERQYWRLNGPNGSPIHDWRAIAKLWAQEKIDRSNNADESDASFDVDEFFERALKHSYQSIQQEVSV